jgi:FMN phosphatase YigB (HAD superfamily)
MKKPKVAFFDLNHTCLQMTGIPKEEIEAYLHHIKHPSWFPLTLPDTWRQRQIWPDVAPGIHNLRYYSRIKCVTLSNNPINVQIDQLRFAQITFDFLVPLEAYHVFKPDIKAYQVACNLLQVAPEDALMVTANHDFGDLEGANTIGMPSVWIDRKNEDDTYPIKNLMDLVKELK